MSKRCNKISCYYVRLPLDHRSFGDSLVPPCALSQRTTIKSRKSWYLSRLPHSLYLGCVELLLLCRYYVLEGLWVQDVSEKNISIESWYKFSVSYLFDLWRVHYSYFVSCFSRSVLQKHHKKLYLSFRNSEKWRKWKLSFVAGLQDFLFIHLSIYLSIYSLIYLFVYSFIHLSIYSSKYLFIYISTSRNHINWAAGSNRAPSFFSTGNRMFIFPEATNSKIV